MLFSGRNDKWEYHYLIIDTKKLKSTVLDVSLMKDSEFAEIPYKTLLKILNRLEEEKLISGISKGVYAIGELNVQIILLLPKISFDKGKSWFYGQYREFSRSA